MKLYTIPAFLVALIFLFSCGRDVDTSTEVKPITKKVEEPVKPVVITPPFNSDSAFLYVQKQVDFGPRVPNTKEHDECGKWMASELVKYGFDTIVQRGRVLAFNGNVLNMQNIIGQYNKEEKERVMFCAHWDTRPFADRDTENKNIPIDGANDGASGVGVLLEVARQVSIQNPRLGVDIIFFDAEDYGAVQVSESMQDLSSMTDTWCLGSQYWCKNPPIPNYKPKYGVLLDMVGAEDAIFPKDAVSRHYAGGLMNKVWKAAQNMGYGNYFVNQLAGAITDDHTYINEMTNIPVIDVIHYIPNGNYGDFGKFHHTHADNMGIVNKKTLGVVGEVMLHIIYQEL